MSPTLFHRIIKTLFPPTAAFDVNQQNEFHNQLESFPTLKKRCSPLPLLLFIEISPISASYREALIPFSSVVTKFIIAMKIINKLQLITLQRLSIATSLLMIQIGLYYITIRGNMEEAYGQNKKSRIALISRMLCFDRYASLLSDSFKALPGSGGGGGPYQELVSEALESEWLHLPAPIKPR